MVLHNVMKAVNVYGDSALIDHKIDRPLTTPGNSPDDPAQYDYWDHVDYLINLPGKKVYIWPLCRYGAQMSELAA